MNKKYINLISIILPLILVVICIVSVVLNNNQAILSSPIKVGFEGEYSYDGVNWFELQNTKDISNNEERVILRGHLNMDVLNGTRFNYYRNHIGVSIYVSGELVYMDTQSYCKNNGMKITPSMCGKEWTYFIAPDILATDEIEINLVNIHKYGNRNAFRDFLDTIYISADVDIIMNNYLHSYVNLFHVAGAIMLILAVMLMGAASVSFIFSNDMTDNLLKKGIMTWFMGGFVWFDTMLYTSSDKLLVVNTYGRQLCMMLAVYFLGLIVRDSFNRKKYIAAYIVMNVSCVMNSVMIGLAAFNKVLLFDTQPVWIISQIIICLLLLVGCIHEVAKGKNIEKWDQICFIILLVAILVDSTGLGASIYSTAIFSKGCFILVLFVYLGIFLKNNVLNYNAVQKNKKLQRELEDSRMAVMLSQIQPHFLYNTLNTIYHLCDKNVTLAKKAINCFSDYLRGNMDSLKKDHAVPFEEELKHVKTYLTLEQMRFDDELNIIYNISVTNFRLPALTIQPLVENAVRYGIAKTPNGGTITISTLETKECYEVIIEDNGVGYDPQKKQEDGKSHIGILNVKQRLDVMMGATLEINGIKNVGTKAVIRIPKEQRDENYCGG